MENTEIEMSLGEQWEHITIANRFMFYKIFTTYPDRLKRLLEILLKIKIDRIIPPQGEKTFDTDSESKSIRLDVYAADDGRLYDVELQNTYEADLPERARYYQSMMDVDTLKHGNMYRDLKDSIIIFICMFDMYKKGKPFYTFTNVCREDSSIGMNDRTTKIFINAKAYDKIEDKEQKDLLRYFVSRKATGSFTSDLGKLVEQHRHNAEWRLKFMNYEMEMLYSKQHGIEEGVHNKAIEDARNLIKMNMGTYEQISQAINLPLEEVQKLAEEIKQPVTL